MAGLKGGDAVDVQIDVEICEALRRGGQEAFRQLLHRHGKFVHSVAYRILKDKARAEDVMQETLLKAYETIGTLKDPKRLRAWLTTIAHRKSIDLVRADKRSRANHARAAQEPTAHAGAPVESLIAEETKRALEECLEAIPAEKRAAVLARFYAELEYLELAKATDENPDTVRIRVSRAMVDLRECLERKGIKP